jgi:hypothetical protein
MEAVLSQLIIESEEAHFKANLPERLKLTSTKVKDHTLEQLMGYFQQRIKTFMTVKDQYKKAGIHFENRWGFTYFKALYQNFAEYIVHCRNEGSPLERATIDSVMTLLKSTERCRFYLNGAKLSMLLETQDALSDAELAFLTNTSEQPWSEYKGILNSYHEATMQKIMNSARVTLKKKTLKTNLKSSLMKAVACVGLFTSISLLAV